jgi:catechol 2,3-dioxygenase-like lactoylglutathione lyase family enzyme
MTAISPLFPVAHEFHMSLRVADLAASTAFYTSFLGSALKYTTARYSTFTVPHLHLNLVLLVNDSGVTSKELNNDCKHPHNDL